MFNGTCCTANLLPGDVYHVDAIVEEGLLNVTAWSSEYTVSLRVEAGDIVEEQMGRIATVCMEIEEKLIVSVLLTFQRRKLTNSDCECASHLLIALKDFASTNENGAKASEELALAICTPSHELYRASRLTYFIATFLSNEESFFVAKKKNGKCKRVRPPKLTKTVQMRRLVYLVAFGNKKWRQATASFSTLMRFVQKYRESFGWFTFDDQSATMIFCK